MAEALRPGGLYKVGGQWVDAEGKEVSGSDLPDRFRPKAAKPAKDDDGKDAKK